MTLKRVLKATGVVAATVVLSLATATGAHADGGDVYTDDADPGGKLSFESNGDIMTVCDVDADGWSAVGYVINPNGSTRYGIRARQNGNCNQRTAADGGRFNLSEGTRYEFRICLDHNGSGPGDDRYCDIASWKA